MDNIEHIETYEDMTATVQPIRWEEDGDLLSSAEVRWFWESPSRAKTMTGR